VENVVNLPLPRQCEADGQWGEDFLNLEGTMVFVIQFLQGTARFNVASAEHHQVPYLVCRRLLFVRVSVSAHPFLCCFQPIPGFVLYRLHAVGVYLTGRVQRFSGWWVDRCGVAPVVSVERRHPISDRERIVVSKFRHREQRYPVFLFPADERSKVGLNRLVEAFRLSVCLWVECG